MEQQPHLDYYRKEHQNSSEPINHTSSPVGSPVRGRTPSGSGTLSSPQPQQSPLSSASSTPLSSSPPPSRYGKFRRLVAGMSMKRDNNQDKTIEHENTTTHDSVKSDE
jgi:hypothetical protein